MAEVELPNKDSSFGYAEVLLQISIVMASISILAVSRRILYFALTSAFLGTALMVNGYFLVTIQIRR
jgi:hypothetical protein